MNVFQQLKKDKVTTKKLALTILILFVTLIGYRIPLLGVNVEYVKEMSNIFGNHSFFNTLMGDSFSRMSLFALGISPYISASILIQLFTIICPPLERIQKDGSIGQKKIEKLTYLVGGILALISSLLLSINLGKQGLFIHYNALMVAFATISWTASACFLIWVGQTIKNKLIGNGISLILMFNILISLPKDFVNIFFNVTHSSILSKIITIIAMFVITFLVFAYVVVLDMAEKRIHITNTNKSPTSMNNVIPLKLNMGGVMPIIFSSTIMSLPLFIAKLFHKENMTFLHFFDQNAWFDLDKPIYTLGIFIFIPLTILFTIFYAKITFNTKDMADNLRRNGSVINGLRPGEPTYLYLKKQVKNLLFIGGAMLIIIALLPSVISGVFNIHGLSFGGTTIIIIVGVLLELKSTIKGHISTTKYKSLIK